MELCWSGSAAKLRQPIGFHLKSAVERDRWSIHVRSTQEYLERRATAITGHRIAATTVEQASNHLSFHSVRTTRCFEPLWLVRLGGLAYSPAWVLALFLPQLLDLQRSSSQLVQFSARCQPLTHGITLTRDRWKESLD